METTPPSSFAKALVVAGASLFLGLFFDYFFFDKAIGISFPAFMLLIVAGMIIISDVFNRPLDKKTHLLFIPLAFFSVMVFVRASPLLTFMNVGGSLLLLLLIARISFARSIQSFTITDYLKTIFLPVKFVRPFFATATDLIAMRGLNKDPKVTSQIIKGIIITVPVLIVFILLFSSADLVFHKYLLDLVNIEIKPETIQRAILILISTSLFIGAYSYLFRKDVNPNHTAPTTSSAHLGHIETSILLGSVNVLFLLFVIVQIAYLFGGESMIAIEGFTYASYVHRGFFELVAVAVISFFMLLNAEKYIVKKDGANSTLFKVLSTALIAQVLVIMGSAFMRLSIYEAAYGFTTLRLYTHTFIVFLGIIFAFLLYKIYIDSRENMLAFRIFIAVIVFVAGMNVLNPDAFIAQKNLDRYKETGKLDGNYMANLSEDALPVSIEIITFPYSEEKAAFEDLIHWNSEWNKKPYKAQWQSWNLSRIKAEKLLGDK